MKVFLGGTKDSRWRDHLIENLKIDYFNPVVEDWTAACQAQEVIQRAECDLLLYVISPKMTGVYSIAEAVEDSIKRPDKTVFCYILCDEDRHFTMGQTRSLYAVGKMVERNGGKFFRKLIDVEKYLNGKGEKNE